MEISVNDIGLNLINTNVVNNSLIIEEPVMMSNKKVLLVHHEELWNLKLRKRPADLKDVEFDLEMQVVSTDS